MIQINERMRSRKVLEACICSRISCLTSYYASRCYTNAMSHTHRNDQTGHPVDVAKALTQRDSFDSQNDALFENAFVHAPIGMSLVGLDGSWLRVNRALCGILGYSPEQLLASDFQAITHPDDLDADLGHVAELLAGGIDSYQMRKRYLHKAGHSVWAHLSVSIVREAGHPRFFISQIQDLTDLMHADEERLAFFTRSPDLLAIAGTNGYLEQVNDRWEEVLGWTPKKLVTTPFLDFVHPDDLILTKREADQTYATNATIGFRNRYLCSDGSYRWLEWNTRVISEEGRLYCVVRDVTTAQIALDAERAKWRGENEAAVAASSRDALTGLANRSAVIAQLDGAIARAARGSSSVAVLFIDLDGFKAVNDTYGHAAGDRVLQQVAARMTGLVRKADLVGRLGGDEFAVVLENLVNGIPDAYAVAAKIAGAVRLPIDDPTGILHVACSVGGAVGKGDDILSSAELLHTADENMYIGKRMGDPGLNIRVTDPAGDSPYDGDESQALIAVP